MNVKKLFSLLLVLGLAVVVAACDKDDNKEKTYTFRTYATAKPTTLNHLAYQDSVESDQLSVLMGALFRFDFNEDNTGYELNPSMAAKEPERKDNGDGTYTWTVELRDDLKWHNGEKITADDFLYTYRMALDPKLNFVRANYFYGNSFPIENAEAYLKQGKFRKCVDLPEGETANNAADCEEAGGTVENWPSDVKFEDVGIKKTGELSFTFTITRDLTPWEFKYQTSSFLFSPVYEPLFEAGMNEDRTETNYGSSVETFIGHGPFKLTYWEDGKELRYEKSEHYFEKDRYFYTHYKTTIVQDSDAALLLFENGELDYVNVPASKFDDYSNHPGLKLTPGSTVFRLNINTMSAEELAEKTNNEWEHKPILEVLEFRQALYFAIDREAVAKGVMKTATPAQYYFSEAYSHNPEQGLIYRDSELGKKVIEDYSPDTYGYVREQAVTLYVEALDKLAEQDLLPEDGVIELEYAAFDGATHEAVGAWLKDQLEDVFNSQTKYPNIEFKLTPQHFPGLDVYYEKQMPGKFDIALGGISGGTLDPIGFLDVFMSDNRSGLFLNWGFDSTVKEIEFDGKTWDYNSLQEAAVVGEYATADFDTKLEILALLESYLIEKQISIPLFSNSAAVVYSDRIDLYSDEYVPLLGFGTLYSTMTEADK